MLTRENEGSKKSVRKVVQDFVHQLYDNESWFGVCPLRPIDCQTKIPDKSCAQSWFLVSWLDHCAYSTLTNEPWLGVCPFLRPRSSNLCNVHWLHQAKIPDKSCAQSCFVVLLF